MRITLKNDFHKTSVGLILSGNQLSVGQIKKARAALCGVKGCICGGIRGTQSPEIIGYKQIEVLSDTGNIKHFDSPIFSVPDRLTIDTTDRILIDAKPVGLSVRQRGDKTVVYTPEQGVIGGYQYRYTEHNMPHARYSLAHVNPKSGAPGRIQFTQDIIALVSKIEAAKKLAIRNRDAQLNRH